MKDISAYNVRTRKKNKINNPELVTLRNGKKAITGTAADDGKTTLYRIVSTSDAQQFKVDK